MVATRRGSLLAKPALLDYDYRMTRATWSFIAWRCFSFIGFLFWPKLVLIVMSWAGNSEASVAVLGTSFLDSGTYNWL
jgi:hypothetical protein